jgi:hypothetical protein
MSAGAQKPGGPREGTGRPRETCGPDPLRATSPATGGGEGRASEDPPPVTPEVTGGGFLRVAVTWVAMPWVPVTWVPVTWVPVS